MIPVSVQLYSLRDASAVDFSAVHHELADIGYAGVEPFNPFGKQPAEFRTEAEFQIDTYRSTNFGACDPAREVARVRDSFRHLTENDLACGQKEVR